jgi:hypothetical protein
MTGDLGLSPIKKEPKRVIYSHRSSHPEAVGSDCTVNLRPSSSLTSSAATAERLCAKKLDGNRPKIDDWSMSLSHCAFISQEYCEYLHISDHLTSICIKKGIVMSLRPPASCIITLCSSLFSWMGYIEGKKRVS